MDNAAGASFDHQPHLAQRLNINTAIHITAVCVSYGMLQCDLYLYLFHTARQHRSCFELEPSCLQISAKKTVISTKNLVDFFRLSHLGTIDFSHILCNKLFTYDPTIPHYVI
jgi:hypothetical protein